MDVYGNGNTHAYNFTQEYDLVKPTAVSNMGCGSCGSSGYTYDPATGFLVGRTDFNGNVTSYVRDARGLELSRTEAKGTAQERTVTTKWHSKFHLPSGSRNRAIRPCYDARGKLLKKTMTGGVRLAFGAKLTTPWPGAHRGWTAH